MAASAYIAEENVTWSNQNDKICTLANRKTHSIITLWIIVDVVICLAAVPLMFVDFWLDENKYNQNMRQYCTYALRNSLKFFYATNELAIKMKEKGELSTDL